MKRNLTLFLPLLFLIAACAGPSSSDRSESEYDHNLTNAWWEIGYEHTGIQSLVNPNDPYRANVLGGSALNTDVQFRLQPDAPWQSIFRRTGGFYRPPEHEPAYSRPYNHFEGNRLNFVEYKPGMPFALEQTFTLNDEVLEWDVVLENRMGYDVEIGDLSIQVPSANAFDDTQEGLFEGGFLRHSYISGDSSFLIFKRRSGKAPYLILTVKPGTHLEYFSGSNYYIHSGLSGNNVPRGTWRQEHTYNHLSPAGQQGDRIEYGFELRWADSYEEMRQILAENGLIDVRVVPGMTVPRELEARFSLHTVTSIDNVTAEFPDETEITYLGETVPNHHVYKVKFDRLGENLITVDFDGGRQTYLEFFTTEPIATMLEKRSRFIVENQQHRDPDLWYDGLYSIWDMTEEALRGPDDTDGYEGWYGYMVASDDPVLGIAPYLASVNALDPVPEQIESIEYHIENFVWDGLQRTDQDDPYPWAVYGVPNWKAARDTVARSLIENRRLDRIKAWRAYDYAHVFMLYYHMHQIADRYPDLVNFRDADGYLEMMWQTARAFFIYPYEIYPWYDIYKWGFMNEVLIPDLADLLEEKGRQEEADWLRHEWEIKARWFIKDDPYPYRSEYPTDRTAFESTYPLARYVADAGGLEPAEDLWYDKNVDVSRSYDRTTVEDALKFMEEQHYAGLAVRGWLETSYYQFGADNSLSYMARMGGYSILNYGLEYADEPHDWLQLGYGSYLSSYALVNSGPPEDNYGFWYPGPGNDGAIGWSFQRSKLGTPWIQKTEERGPWRYDGEGNLGFNAVTRMASTILAEDPVFGHIAYGGNMEITSDGYEILPKDGVRIRFWLVDDDHRLGLHLERDGWSETRPIRVNEELDRIDFIVENRTDTQHTNRLELEVRAGEAEWRVMLDGEEIAPQQHGVKLQYDLNITGDEHELTLERL
ncbi:MAG: DUF5695 domain-containing protein [Balneolaceae bacterium]